MGAEIGRRSQVAIGREETSYGTLSASLLGLPFTDLTVNETKKTVPNNQAYGRIEKNSEGSKIGSQEAEVVMSGVVSVVAIGYFLKAIFGTMTTADDTPVANSDTHTFIVDNDSNEHPSYSIVYKDGIQQLAVLGARLNSFTINIVAGEWATFEANFIGKFPVTNASSITYTDEEKFTAAMASLKMGANIAGLGAAIPVVEGSIIFEKNTKPQPVWGSVDLLKTINEAFDVRAEITKLWEDTTQRALFTGHTVQALQVKITTDVFVTGSTPYDLEINIRNGKVTEHAIDRGLDNVMEESFTLMGEYDFSEASMVDAVLINGTDGSVYGVG